MTIKVSVSNDDTRDDAIIKVVTTTVDPGEEGYSHATYLGAGETGVFHVHSNQSLMVLEHKG